MNKHQELLCQAAEENKQLMLDAERWIWAHPQTGYTEWEADAYLTERFEALGYTLTKAGNIPGFITDLDTGKPGPMLCIMGELDALDLSNHPEAVNGMAHACGHNGQAAAMLGIAAALKAPGALDGLSGKIRLMLVPAEEMIQLDFREDLRKQGIIKYNGGKPEFMYRGLFDGVDISMMVHGSNMGDDHDFGGGYGMNGCIAKVFTFKGKASHAGGSPEHGINAQYAAMLGLQAVNDLRETFPDNDHIRFHPVMGGVNCAVNIIPNEMKIESYVRGASLEAIKRENKKINRALAGAAMAIGAGVDLCDRPGYAPEIHDKEFMELTEEICKDLVGAERVNFNYSSWATGSSDFGDVTCVMPGMQFWCAGASGHGHGTDYFITDPYRLCVNSAKAQLMVMDALLRDNAEKAKHIIANYKPQFSSIKEYLASLDEITLDKDAVKYGEDGSITIDYMN